MKCFAYIAVLAFGMVVAISPATQAGVISRDWKSPGDGLLTYDDVNRREWLDLTETVRAVGRPISDIVDELNAGGAFEGFNVAVEADVRQLATSAGLNVDSDDLNDNQLPATSFIQLLGDVGRPGDMRIASGAVWPLFGTRDGPYIAFVFTDEYRAGYRATVGTSQEGIGVWLYRSVPEPSSLILSTTVFLTFIVFSKRLLLAS